MRWTLNRWTAGVCSAALAALLWGTAASAEGQQFEPMPASAGSYQSALAAEPAGAPLAPGGAAAAASIPQRSAFAADVDSAFAADGAEGIEPTAYEAEQPAPTADGLTLSDLKQQFNSWLDERNKSTYPNVTVNGVFQADAGFFSQDAASVLSHGDIEDGADFRRARLNAKGALTETMNYFFQMDFAFFGRPTFTDVWLEQTALPGVGNFRIGQWKQPFSLEVVSSFRYTTFMERSLLFQAFTPFRHLGAGFYNHSANLNWTWAASGFRSGQDQFGDSISDDGGWGTAERLTHLFFYDEPSGGRYYLHGGLGHFYSNPPNDRFNFRTIPEFFVGENAPVNPPGTSGTSVPGNLNGTPFFVSTGALNLRNYNVLGTELLWVNGPFSLQSETMVAFADRYDGPNNTFWGSYAQVGYFLTGEHRPYDRNAGCIDRVKTFSNFFIVDTSHGTAAGWGAWELAARVSYIDLNDRDVRGGQLTDVTAGLNWFWNPYTKLVFNYIHAFNNNPIYGNNDTDMYACRAQIDF